MTGLEQLAQSVREAAGDPRVGVRVGELYEKLRGRIEERRPICSASGRCCRFEEFGHRLYVTTVELAAFLEQATKRRSDEATKGGKMSLPVVGEGGGCPFQEGGLCSVHEIRPFGCRVFFCDETSTDWQQAQYEELHGELKKLHVELGVAYFYVEWRQALAILGLARS